MEDPDSNKPHRMGSLPTEDSPLAGREDRNGQKTQNESQHGVVVSVSD